MGATRKQWQQVDKYLLSNFPRQPGDEHSPGLLDGCCPSDDGRHSDAWEGKRSHNSLDDPRRGSHSSGSPRWRRPCPCHGFPLRDRSLDPEWRRSTTSCRVPRSKSRLRRHRPPMPTDLVSSARNDSLALSARHCVVGAKARGVLGSLQRAWSTCPVDRMALPSYLLSNAAEPKARVPICTLAAPVAILTRIGCVPKTSPHRGHWPV